MNQALRRMLYQPASQTVMAWLMASVLIIFLSLTLATGAHAQAAEDTSNPRKALVIGNDSYQNIAKLKNARADASAIAIALQGDGFDVTLLRDLSDQQMKEAVRNFKSKVKDDDEVIFYFAGHGVQIQQDNYLLPIDITGDSADQVRDDALRLQRVLDDMREVKAKFTLAIIDACRNNPFSTTGRTVGTLGLAPTNPAAGQMVIYSANSGQEALDRLSNADHDPNGLFTRIFLQEMNQGGLTVVEVLENVKERVVEMAKKAGHEQLPAVYNASVGKFYFKRVSLEPVPAPSPVLRPSPSSEEIETQAWTNIKDSRDGKDFEDYLNAYPNGRYALLARQKKKNLTVVAAPVVAPVAQTAQTVPSGPFKDCSNCPEMVVIPSGSFMMGSPASEAGRESDEGPQHPVSVRSYALGKTHVTRGQYAAFVTDTGYQSGTSCWTLEGGKFQDTPGRTWKNPGFAQRDDEPVVCVNWEDTQAYVRWLSGKTGQTYRLPSEAEWEYACRAGQQQLYCGSNDVDSVAWYGGNSGLTTHPVGQKQANAWGLVDMSGNAFEWTQDCYHDSYSGAPSDGSAWLSGNCGGRVLRGGSWSITPRWVRSAIRGSNIPGDRYGSSGFRVARTLN